MSYSFSKRAATKAAVIAAVAEELDAVVTAQPVHAADKEQALEAASAFVNVLPNVDSKDITVSVSGSVGWQGTAPDGHTITSAQVSVYAALADPVQQ